MWVVGFAFAVGCAGCRFCAKVLICWYSRGVTAWCSAVGWQELVKRARAGIKFVELRGAGVS